MSERCDRACDDDDVGIDIGVLEDILVHICIGAYMYWWYGSVWCGLFAFCVDTDV